MFKIRKIEDRNKKYVWIMKDDLATGLTHKIFQFENQRDIEELLDFLVEEGLFLDVARQQTINTKKRLQCIKKRS